MFGKTNKSKILIELYRNNIFISSSKLGNLILEYNNFKQPVSKTIKEILDSPTDFINWLRSTSHLLKK